MLFLVNTIYTSDYIFVSETCVMVVYTIHMEVNATHA